MSVAVTRNTESEGAWKWYQEKEEDRTRILGTITDPSGQVHNVYDTKKVWKLDKKQKVYNDVFDIRLADLQVSENGRLELGFDYGRAHKPNDDTVYTNNERVKDGYLITAEHTQGNFFGGFNKFVVLEQLRKQWETFE